jgi:hypothetical protein
VRRMPWQGPDELRIVPVRAPLEVHRIVRVADRDAPDLVDSFRSSFELGKQPRRKSPETAYRAIYQGISVYAERAQAMSTANRFRTIGGYVARLLLPADAGFSVATWGSDGHMTA